jgi:hypothetical protein
MAFNDFVISQITSPPLKYLTMNLKSFYQEILAEDYGSHDLGVVNTAEWSEFSNLIYELSKVSLTERAVSS